MRRPHERKRELANLVRSRVHCRGMHHVEAERAAEYVVYGDQNGRYLPERVLLKLLDELDEADRKGQIETYVKDNQVYSNRGKWFVGVLKKRLREHDVQQQKCKRRPEQ